MPAVQMPGFRTELAISRGVERNLIFKTWGGIGDQICAEPTLRFALKNFKNVNISLASERPELFQHLDFHKTFDLNESIPNYDKYLAFETITPPDESNLVWQFFSHLLTNCVDFTSLCALRMQLPVADREVILKPPTPSKQFLFDLKYPIVCVHAGKHWASKTFPKDWWDAVLHLLKKSGVCPVLIGANTDDNRGTVDVSTEGCIDFRNKLSIMETVWLLQQSEVLLTNDSAPLHMAVTGDAWIGYVATCKHPDMITHWRKGIWGHRMQNLGSGGMWDIVDHCPNAKEKIEVAELDEVQLRKWLPHPEIVAQWVEDRV